MDLELHLRLDSQDAKIDCLFSQMQDLCQSFYSMKEILDELPNSREKMMGFVNDQVEESSSDVKVKRCVDGHNEDWKLLWQESLLELNQKIKLFPPLHSQKEIDESSKAPSLVTHGIDDCETVSLTPTGIEEQGYQMDNRESVVDQEQPLYASKLDSQAPYLSGQLDIAPKLLHPYIISNSILPSQLLSLENYVNRTDAHKLFDKSTKPDLTRQSVYHTCLLIGISN